MNITAVTVVVAKRMEINAKEPEFEALLWVMDWEQLTDLCRTIEEAVPQISVDLHLRESYSHVLEALERGRCNSFHIQQRVWGLRKDH